MKHVCIARAACVWKDCKLSVMASHWNTDLIFPTVFLFKFMEIAIELSFDIHYNLFILE